MTYNRIEHDYANAQMARLQDELKNVRGSVAGLTTAKILAAYLIVMAMGAILGALAFWVLSA